MGTRWSAKTYLPENVCAADVDHCLQQVFEAYIKVFSLWEPQAFISRFNGADVGTSFEVPEVFQRIWEASIEVSRQSYGAFNPYCFSEISKRGYNPSYESQRSDYGRPIANSFFRGQSFITKGNTPHIDLNAIAKGGAVDAMADGLRQLGCMSFLVEIGGEFFGQGLKEDNQPWWIDTENASSSATIHRVALSGFAVATSGNAHKKRLNGSDALGHILQHKRESEAFASVTVIHPNCMYADAWATALFASPKAAMEIANTQKLSVIFENISHKFLYSKMLKEHFIE